MTREEAIKIAYNKRKDSAGEAREFYNAVISALEKEDIYDDKEHYVTISKALYDKLNVDICEDAISREAVIEWLKAKDIIKMSWQEKNAREELQAFKNLPSVRPSKPCDSCKHWENRCTWLPSRKGHWIEYGKLWKCSECEDLSCCHENYCNHCGADMRESGVSE